jgi:hypothetical protein
LIVIILCCCGFCIFKYCLRKSSQIKIIYDPDEHELAEVVQGNETSMVLEEMPEEEFGVGGQSARGAGND